MTMLEVYFTNRFKKDYKQMVKRGCKPALLEAVVEQLRMRHLCRRKTAIMS